MIEALGLVRAVRDETEDGRPAGGPAGCGQRGVRGGHRDLVDAGRRRGQGRGRALGAMCTTRMMTGVGRPQFSAVLECAARGRRRRRDGVGGRRGQVPARRGAGARRRRGQRDGRLLVRRHLRERRRPRPRPDGRWYKESFGMASARAVKHRTRSQSAFDRARSGAVRGGHLHLEDVSRSRPSPVSRTWSTRSSPACAARSPTPARPTSRSFSAARRRGRAERGRLRGGPARPVSW